MGTIVKVTNFLVTIRRRIVRCGTKGLHFVRRELQIDSDTDLNLLAERPSFKEIADR